MQKSKLFFKKNLPSKEDRPFLVSEIKFLTVKP